MTIPSTIRIAEELPGLPPSETTGTPLVRHSRSCDDRNVFHTFPTGLDDLDREVPIGDWMLTSGERGNPDTMIDRRRGDESTWTSGNDVAPLVHGRTYFDVLLSVLEATTAGDMIMFTDWRGDPDEALDDSGTAVSTVMCEAAARGVLVKGLIWRSHLDVLHFSSQQNRRLGSDIEEAGGECLLDMRVRPGGSHHQKLVVVRHRDRPELDVAFVGGIDLCHSRRDDRDHDGDDQPDDMADAYGETPPWHDVQVAVRGPAVGDVELSFRERWSDPAKLSHNPFRLARGVVSGENMEGDRSPAQLPDPLPRGGQTVQVLRTYPHRWRSYPFAGNGERSIARAYTKALGQARSLIYLEDQYLWSIEIAQIFAAALRRAPELRLIAVVPMYPDSDGIVGRAQVIGREYAMRLLREAGGDRVSVYAVENRRGIPVYVHAKVCIIDDVWSCVGSDNLNLRSWTHDSEISCAVMDDDGGTGFGQRLRLQLNREHLDRAAGDDADLRDAEGLYAAYRKTAETLDAWHDGGTGTPRPPGRLRTYTAPTVGGLQALLAKPVYHLICDPDGRPRRLRRLHTF
jgi:phosphatidylserine/phosphatidylglycerophosphate/cardiolipin synthase-like enzyme